LLVMTRGVNERTALDEEFAKLVASSLKRFVNRDWGELAGEDRTANDWAVDHGERVLAAYGTEPDKIWIIREWDGSATTILFPDEY